MVATVPVYSPLLLGLPAGLYGPGKTVGYLTRRTLCFAAERRLPGLPL
jgi:hypothetical protein